MAGPPICPTCGKPLEGGFLLDNMGRYGFTVTQWIEGVPERSFWTGLKFKGRRRLPMSAWRCPSCCEVRLYAPDP